MKFNRKSVTVVTDNGQRLNISPHPLSPIKDRTGGDGGGYKAQEIKEYLNAPPF